MIFILYYKYTNSFLLFFLITTLIPQTNQFITLRLSESYESFDLYIKISPPEYIPFQFELDLTSPHLWITSFPFKPESNNITLFNSPTEILVSHNSTYLSQPYMTSFYFSSNDFHNKYYFNNSILLYHISTNTSIPFFDAFPLAHSIPDPNTNSPIHYLYNNKTITSKSFSIEFNLFTHNCKLHIGNVTEYYLSKYKYNVKLKPVNNNDYMNYWLIDFKEIHFEFNHNDTVSIFSKKQNEIAYLQGNKDAIKVPGDFFTYLEKELFKEYMEKKICHIIHKFKSNCIECDCSAIYDFPMLVFIINNYKVKLGYRDLFRRYNSETTECGFLMKYYFDNQNAWMFGIPFLSAHTAVFNYDEDSITLYNDDYIYEKISSSEKNNFNFAIKHIYSWNAFICVAAIVLLFSMKRII